MSDRNVRLGLIIRSIARKPGITLTQLHHELSERHAVNVTERTLAKDIALLKSEFRLLPDKDRLRSGYVLSGMFTLSEPETALVMDAIQVFGHRLKDSQAQRMLERLSGLMREHPELVTLSSVPIRTMRQHNIYKKAHVNSNVEQVLTEAISAQLPVEYVYKTPRLEEPEVGQGYPLLLVFHERGWYCIVRDLDQKNYRPRRVDRFVSLNPGQAKPNHRHIADVNEAQFLMSCGWGMSFPANAAELEEADRQPEIVVRFQRAIAPYILEAADRHPRAKVVRLRDGTGDVEFRIKLLKPSEFQYWVRAFGAKAWITHPPALVEQERTELRRMSQRYQSEV